MKTYFITGAAQSVTNSVERFTAMRQHHPEWDEGPSEKAITRERLAHVAEPDVGADRSRWQPTPTNPNDPQALRCFRYEFFTAIFPLRNVNTSHP